jgi:hypothetical protein
MPLLRDVVAAIGVGFERHDWDPGVLRWRRGFPMRDLTAEPSPADIAQWRNPDPQGPWRHGLGRGRCSLLSSPGRRPAGPCNKVSNRIKTETQRAA